MNFILIIISLILSFFAKPTYAVDFPSIPLNNIEHDIYVESGTPIDSISSLSIISESSTSQDSTQKRQSSSLKNELESSYEINEEVTVELFNRDANLIQTKLINDNNQKIEAEVNQVNEQGITTLTIDSPPQLKPGKYTIEIIDQTGTKIEQDFLWGVLAINPNKSVYSPGETADLAMAVLNETGEMVCNANLILKITDPDGKSSELSTENNKIIINQTECQSSKFTLKPDYQAFFKTSKDGQYLMELTAETKNGTYTINDSFEVKSNIDFDIERISATRIYPPNIYPMIINLKANRDFKGYVYEEVPASFDLTKGDDDTNFTVNQVDQKIKKIKWSVDIKKGDSITLKYQYKAPDISPQFYLAGPLQLNTDTDLIYKESRRWQIAADAVGEVRTKTVQFFIGQNGAAAGIAAGVTWPTTFSVYLPDAVSSADAIKSAYIEYSFATATTGAGGIATFGLKLTSEGTFTTQTSVSYTSSTENLTLKGKADFTAKLKADIQSAGTYTYNFYDRLASVARKADNAKIVITYDYNSEATTQINTVRFYGGMVGTTLAVGVTAALTLAQPSLPENSPSIYDAWAEITASTVSTSTVDETVRVRYDADAYSYYYYDNAGGAGSQVINLLHRKVITDASHVLSVGSSAGYPLTLLGYEQFITYSFNYTNSTTLLKTIDFLVGANGTKATTTTLSWNRTINIPESSINWKSIYVNGSAHSGNDSVTQLSAKIGATATSFTNSYTYDWNGETSGNYRILSNETNNLGTSMTTGNNNVYIVWKVVSGGHTSRSANLVLTYSHAKSDETINASAKFLVSNGKTYTTGQTTPFIVDVSGPTQNISSQLKLDSHINSTTDAIFRLSVLPSTTLAYNVDASLEYMMVTIGHTLTTQVGATGTYTATLDSSVAAAKYADITLNFQYAQLPPLIPSLISPTNSATDISQTPSFVTLANDGNNDDLQYEVKICTNSAMSTGCQTFTAANTGWSGADVGTSSFSAGTTATYVLQVGNSLARSTEYFWKTRSLDPAGSNTWSSTQTTPYSFTTVANPPPNTPSNSTPTNNAVGQSLNPTLIGSAFSDPLGDTHANSQWQVFDVGMTTTTVDGSYFYPAPQFVSNIIGGTEAAGGFTSTGENFTVAQAIDIAGVALKLEKMASPTDIINVDFMQGTTGGTLLTSGTIPATSISGSVATYNIVFNNIVSLSVGTTYVIRITRSPDVRDETNYIRTIISDAGFARGQLVDRYNNAWQTSGTYDLWFGLLESNKVWDSGTTSTNKTSIAVNTTNGTFSGSLSGQTLLSQGTQYTWKVRYQNSSSSWSSYSSPTTFTTIYPPNTPTNSTPTNGAGDQSSNTTLTSSSFSDPDPSDTHANSQWQVFGLGGSNTETSVTGGFYHPTPNTDNTVIGGSSTSLNRVQSNGQSFNLSTGITVAGVILNLAKYGSPSDYITISLLSGSITGTVLASSTLPASQITTTPTNYHINFTGSASLSSGTTYYLRVSRLPDSEDEYNYVTVSGAGAGGVFTQGTLYYKYNNVWSADAGDDLYFGLLEPGYSDKVWDSGTTSTNKTSIVVNTTNGTFSGSLSGQTALASATTYSWQLRHQDNNGLWSSYSDSTIFTVATLGPKANQNHFRWRDDSATLSTNSGWLANEDVGYTAMIKDSSYRLRLEIANDGSGPLSSQQFRLEYAAKNGAVCGGNDETFITVPVTATSEAFEMINSSQYANDDTISSSFLTATGTFVNGKAVEDPGNTTSSVGITNSYYSEYEYAIKPTTNSVGGTDYCFRVTNVGSTANFIYSFYSQAQIKPIPNITQSSFRWRNDDGGEMVSIGSTRTFATGTTYPTNGGVTWYVTSADFNSDGHSDLVTANGDSHNITVFLNNGSGTFGAGTTYPTIGTYPSTVISTDVNSDGKPDLVTANYGGAADTITVFLNNGSGTFGTGTTYPTLGDYSYYVTSADLNSDGKPDLITANYESDTVTVFTNNGSGTFGAGTTYPTGANTGPFPVISADLNSDGKPDLITANYDSNNVTVLTNTGSGTFGAGTTYPTLGTSLSSIVSADVNSDGKPDLITSNQGNHTITVLTNTGSGTFGAGTTYPTIGDSPASITSADINSDGKPDLITANYGDNNVTVFTNNGSGTFSDRTTYSTLGNNPNSVTSSDVNNDGKPDLVTADFNGKNITVFVNTFTGSNTYGTFGTGVTYPTGGSYPWNITHGDFNKDGKEDLASVNGTVDKISIFLNSGNGTYGTGVTYASINEPTGISSADFNHDGYDDLVTANRDNTSILVYINDRDGTFAAGASYSTIGVTPYAVSSGDFNNDGYPDIVSANYSSDNLTVFINDGDGTFATGATYSTIGDGPRVVTNMDANRDGYLDLASGNYNDGSITILINDGDGTYGTGTTYPSLGTWIYSIISDDFNQDGYPDLSTANQASDNFTILINDGDGTYATGVTYSTIGTDPRSVTSADFNHDGKTDIAVSLQGSDTANIFFNDGNGVFSIGASYPVGGADPYTIISTDVNGDGNPDLATSNFESANITVFTNIGTAATFGASWKAAENIGITDVDLDTNLRLRFSVKNTVDFGSFNLRLQVAPLGASAGCTGVPSVNFSDVPTTVGSAVAVMTTSPEFNNQSSTTNQMTNSSTTYVAGKMVEYSSNQTDSITLNTNQFTETEYNFQMTSNASGNTPYCFRVVDVATTLNSYSQVAQLTTSMNNEAPSAPFLPYVNNTTASSGQQTPVYGLIDHTPAFSAVFDDPNTSDTSSNYQLQVGSDTDWASAEIWDSTKSSIGSTCNENSRCADIVYGGGTSLVDGSTYYWRIKFWDNSDTEGSWSDTQQFSMNNSPTVSSVVINGNNSINLSENSSIGISWISTATDADTHTNLSSVTGKIYRSGLGSTCTLDNNNCYTDASCDFYNCSGNSCSVLCLADLYFFTEATDAGSTFASQYYQAWVEATDLRTEVGSTISTSTTVDVNTMSAFSIGSSLVYGEVFAGSDTGSSNTITTITNTGNSLINLEITGDYMCTDYPSCGGQSIEPTNQQYKLSTFNYGTGTTLTNTPQIVNIGISKPTETPSNSFKNIYWGIGIPSLKEPGNYQGAITILVD